MTTNNLLIFVVAAALVGLLLSTQLIYALTEQEKVDQMTKEVNRLGKEMHTDLTKIITCTKLSESKNAKDDPVVRRCLKLNMNWTDADIDFMLGQP